MKKIPVYTLQTISCKPSKIGHMEMVRFEDHLKNLDDVHFPHRHDFYYLLYVLSGKGTHTIDFKTFDFKPGQLYVMSPGQVHEWDIRSAMKGYVIFFNPDLFYNDGIRIEEQWPYFHSLFYEPLHPIASSYRQDLEQWFEWMFRQYKEFEPRQDLIMKHLLTALLYKITNSIHLSQQASDRNTIVRRYELLLDQHFVTHHDIGFYAEKLHITSNYLNSLCKKEVGKSAKTLLSERLMLEAKRLLRHSVLDVGQVSDYLHYQSPSYFTRYFKKQERITPLEFRNARIVEK